MTELQILSAVKNNNGSIEYTALLNLNLSDPYQDASADKDRVEKMIEAKLLKGETRAHSSIAITKHGRRYLQDSYYLEDQNKKLAEERTKNKANENRHDWFLAIGGAFVAGLVGLAFELIVFFFLK